MSELSWEEMYELRLILKERVEAKKKAEADKQPTGGGCAWGCLTTLFWVFFVPWFFIIMFLTFFIWFDKRIQAIEERLEIPKTLPFDVWRRDE